MMNYPRLLTCFLLFSIPASTASAQKILYGELDVKVRLFRFVINVDKDNFAKLTSLDEGGQVFKVDPFEFDDETLNFDLKLARAVYESKFDKKAKAYKGKWKQAGREYDLDFKSVEAVPKDTPTEIWEGALALPGQKLTLRFRIYDREKHAVLMDSPDQRAGGFSGKLTKDGAKRTFEIPALRGKFSGELDKEDKVLKGTWTQGAEFGMELKKVSAKDMKSDAEPPKRPQTPKAPFPYEAKSVKIENKDAGLTLAATLTVPNGNPKFPCVVLISGSGAQDRDETLMGHKPFWVLADHFGRNGIACLRFDDRGTAKSTGDHDIATSEDFASDVSAIVDFLKQQPKIDSSKIGLCGHSEGGLIAPMVAAKRDDIAFIVMLAGPGVNGEKILKNQLRLILKASKVDEKEIEIAAYLQTRLIKLAKSESGFTDESLAAVVDGLIEKFPAKKEDREQILKDSKTGSSRLDTNWMKFFLTYEPGPALTKVACPVLVLNGTKDTQVDPRLNLPAIRAAFESVNKTNFKMEELPDLNHLFQTSETGSLDEYQSIEETFAPIALSRITTWINETVN